MEAPANSNSRRARRYGVDWTARVHRVDEDAWHTGRVVNLSVTGVLLQTQHRYRIGDCVEVEIEFLAPHATTIISGVGHVIREDSTPGSAAIAFVTECGIKTRS